ncbi:unnamed protein product [Polarella glacialis]|uniref:Uncharacterized protein n=1 Tax=Polarella glacialis TaxID=89957 RepID=A0A813KWK5_POLGL|nr:unnamed protein product [Polarella glacialis]
MKLPLLELHKSTLLQKQQAFLWLEFETASIHSAPNHRMALRLLTCAVLAVKHRQVSAQPEGEAMTIERGHKALQQQTVRDPKYNNNNKSNNNKNKNYVYLAATRFMTSLNCLSKQTFAIAA